MLCVATQHAHAQTSDIAPPMPNVLILLDTSGSMERMGNASIPNLAPGQTSTTIKNRWANAIETLLGPVPNYKLLAVDRKTQDFKNEYSLGGQAPYDSSYYLDHYRVMSGACTIGPSTDKTWPTDWVTWGPQNFGWRTWNGGSLGTLSQANSSCGPSQLRPTGGVIDVFADQARFGLMMFDTLPHPGSGWVNGAQNAANGMLGQWSYFPNWDVSSANKRYGWPQGCDLNSATYDQHIYENGARNPSAPPWEGPLIGFAARDETNLLQNVNDRIRYSILSMRPYGATPIGPMMADAKYYLHDDPRGPTSDVFNNCRGQFVLLLTDGFPNQDLRPSCENNPDPRQARVFPACNPVTSGPQVGCCPSGRPQDIAESLLNTPGKPKVKTFVVGFSLLDDTNAPVNCNDPRVDPVSGQCAQIVNDATNPLRQCCTLHEIAYRGGTQKAYFANDPDSLRASLVQALSEATLSTATSRTIPVFTSAVSTNNTGNIDLNPAQYEFRSSFKVSRFSAWTGSLERIRWQCSTVSGVTAPREQDFSAELGDDFAANLNSDSSKRNYISYNGIDSSLLTDSSSSIRPRLASAGNDTDGVEKTAGVGPITGTGPLFVSATNMTPAAMNITSIANCTGANSLEECKAKYLNYAIAQPQLTKNPAWASRVGNAMGDIFHATPVVVPAPNSFIRDESYIDFRTRLSGRKPFILAATNDGLLHAFAANITRNEQNEMWAFLPPAVLPNLYKQYGGGRALLLDAAPIVRDVALGDTTGSAQGTVAWGRSRVNAQGGRAQWRTIAVGALTSGNGYYALDITDTGRTDSGKPADPVYPTFLWQLTTVNGRKLFGDTPGTPAIGTVYYRDKDSSVSEPIETPVAFLPGGSGRLFNSSSSCPRWQFANGGSPSASDPTTTPRQNIRCWNGPGLSFTVVRLYDGKILRTFRNDPNGRLASTTDDELTDSPVSLLSTEVVKDIGGNYAGIDSPITGTVALYPANIGSVTTRAFVGDIDGALWKADLSDSNPRNWTFSLFHDAYSGETDTAQQPAWSMGQPASVAPVLSVDRFSRIVINYATGDQNLAAQTSVNFVHSLTEVINNNQSSAQVNWKLRFPNGITPTGPLSLFDSQLFFSTYSPGSVSSDACFSGQGVVWGVDYLATEDVSGARLPVPRLQVTSSDDGQGVCPGGYPNRGGIGSSYFRCINNLPIGTIIFGAGVTQRPSCVTTSGANSLDPYTGLSVPHQTVGDIIPGDFQLVVQTGPKGQAAGSALTKTLTRTLTTPITVTRMDSWATMIE